ncbi:signal peptidase I [Streptohalobacillus salinus]|uniref:Signal peptidase I n=1 Tax=Streptohalobacillus salinus TaxID=621096 RepID=A0A2V3WUK4_9BACI|nr:signal peptidase I [Streptohalobacillus salinus]PXW92652.1 signal peptidase I [Streptohalobacillus salinus]
MTEKKNKKVLSFFVLFITLVITMLFVRQYIFKTAIVDGKSMMPTVNDEQTILYNRLSYLFSEPTRGDVVVIEKENRTYIKRIIGLPQETIEVIDQQLYINQVPYQQAFITDAQSFWTHDIVETMIPKSYYYVMGDNRRNSRDTRNSLGFIHRDEIIGRAELIIYPISSWQVIY